MNNPFDNLIKINNPIGKLEFFKYSVLIFLAQLVFALLFIFLTGDFWGFKSIILLPLLFVIFIEVPLLYLYFIQCAKRLWDITDNKNTAIIINSFLFVISVIGMISFPAITVIIYLVLILYQGKIVKDV